MKDPSWDEKERIWRRVVSPFKSMLLQLDYLFVLRYNGFGGKVEPGETPEQAAIRELKVREIISTTWYRSDA